MKSQSEFEYEALKPDKLQLWIRGASYVKKLRENAVWRYDAVMDDLKEIVETAIIRMVDGISKEVIMREFKPLVENYEGKLTKGKFRSILKQIMSEKTPKLLKFKAGSKVFIIARQSSYKKNKQGIVQNVEKHETFLKLSLDQLLRRYDRSEVGYAYVSDFSGYGGARLTEILLFVYGYEVVVFEDVSRFSRNVSEGVDVLNRAFRNKKRIIARFEDITQGTAYLGALFQLIMGEFELGTKITRIKNRVRFLVDFVKGVRQPNTMEEDRFIQAVQYVGKLDFLMKAKEKLLRGREKALNNSKKSKEERERLAKEFDVLLELVDEATEVAFKDRW